MADSAKQKEKQLTDEAMALIRGNRRTIQSAVKEVVDASTEDNARRVYLTNIITKRCKNRIGGRLRRNSALKKKAQVVREAKAHEAFHTKRCIN